MLAEDWRKIGGEWAEDWREKFPPYPLEVFPPLRGVEKTSGKLGSGKGIIRSPAWRLRELVCASRRWLSHAAISFTYVRPPVRGVRQSD